MDRESKTISISFQISSIFNGLKMELMVYFTTVFYIDRYKCFKSMIDRVIHRWVFSSFSLSNVALAKLFETTNFLFANDWLGITNGFQDYNIQMRINVFYIVYTAH